MAITVSLENEKGVIGTCVTEKVHRLINYDHNDLWKSCIIRRKSIHEVNLSREGTASNICGHYGKHKVAKQRSSESKT